MTNIKDMHCIDKNWIENELEELILQRINEPENDEFISGKIYVLKVLKAQLKPITSLNVISCEYPHQQKGLPQYKLPDEDNVEQLASNWADEEPNDRDEKSFIAGYKAKLYR